MNLFRTNINGIDLVIEKKELSPQVFCYMVSMQNDPKMFPMIHKKEFGGWFFVDKMTFVEFMEIEKSISLAIEKHEGIFK
jgi:hypothetical protein